MTGIVWKTKEPPREGWFISCHYFTDNKGARQRAPIQVLNAVEFWGANPSGWDATVWGIDGPCFWAELDFPERGQAWLKNIT